MRSFQRSIQRSIQRSKIFTPESDPRTRRRNTRPVRRQSVRPQRGCRCCSAALLPRKSRLVRNDFMVGGRAAASIVIITAIILLFFFILPLLPSTSHRRSPRPTPRPRSLCAFLAFLCENIRQRTPHVHECAIPTRIQNVPRWSVCSLTE